MKLPLDKVTQVIVHADCPDGIASAMIIRDVLPWVPIHFKDHGEDLDSIEVLPNTLFCDIAPPDKLVDEFIKAEAMVLDHHKHSKEKVKRFKFGIFADEFTEPGVSGAVLAWRHVWLPGYDSKVEEFQKLAGIRDTWQNKDSDWQKACEQAEALLFYPIEHWLPNDPGERHEPCLTVEEKKLGKLLYARRLQSADKIVKKVYPFEYNGFSVAICMNGSAIDDASEKLREKSFNVIMGFSYDCLAGKPSITFSLRSDGVLDVGAMAKYYGGGGHSKASGFSIPVENNHPQPYNFSKMLFIEYCYENEIKR